MDTIIQVAFGIKLDSLAADEHHPVIVHARKLFSTRMPVKDIVGFMIMFTWPTLAQWLGIRFHGEVMDFFDKFASEIVAEYRRESRDKLLGKANNFIELLLEAEMEGENGGNEKFKRKCKW